MPDLSPQDVAYQQSHIDEDRGPIINGVTSMFVVLCTLAVGARIFVRRIKHIHFGLDDYFCIVAYVSQRASSNILC